jgi:hypothetical protein
MKTQTKEQQTGNHGKHSSSSSHKEIKTDMPMSEKDEVKNAERRTRKALKDHL